MCKFCFVTARGMFNNEGMVKSHGDPKGHTCMQYIVTNSFLSFRSYLIG